MSDGMFAGLDLESANDDPFNIPDGSYNAFVTEVKVGPTKDGSKQGMTTIFRISEGEHEGKTVSRWLIIPDVSDPKNPSADESRALSFLKSHILSMGVPAEEVSSINAEDLVGTEVIVSVKNRDGYTNVRKIIPASAVDGSLF